MSISVPVVGVPGVLDSGGGGDPGAVYTQLLIDTYGASEVWRLTDIESGTGILAQVSSARDGVLQGWTLQTGGSPVSGEATQAPYSDGVNDYGDIATASLSSIFNGQVGSVFMWFKADAAVWGSSADRTVLTLSQGNVSTNLILIRLSNSGVEYFYRAGTVTETHIEAYSSTNWTSAGINFNLGGDLAQFALNGSQVGGDQSGLGTWSGGTLAAVIGALTTVPSFVMLGSLAYLAVKFGSTWSIAEFAAMHAAVAG